MMGSWVRAPVGSQKVVRYANDLFFFKAMWRTGRLAILRGWCSQGREGSNPSMVTNKKKRLQNNQACLKLFCKRFFFQSGALLGKTKSILILIPNYFFPIFLNSALPGIFILSVRAGTSFKSNSPVIDIKTVSSALAPSINNTNSFN